MTERPAPTRTPLWIGLFIAAPTAAFLDGRIEFLDVVPDVPLVAERVAHRPGSLAVEVVFGRADPVDALL